jgi:hypothetical protein
MLADMYHSLQERGFAALQARQKLLASFADFPQLLTQNLNNCLRDPHKSVDHAMQYPHRCEQWAVNAAACA